MAGRRYRSIIGRRIGLATDTVELAEHDNEALPRSPDARRIVVMTQVEYNAITPEADTVYLIVN